jgi:ABC-type glutathione transport system ATPase component
MAIILITHDLGVVAEMADEVAVMYAGRVVERAPGRRSSTTRSIPIRLACSARSRRSRKTATGCWRSRAPCRRRSMPSGCRFHPRCVFADAACTAQDPPLRSSTMRTTSPACARRSKHWWHDRPILEVAGPGQALSGARRHDVRSAPAYRARCRRHLLPSSPVARRWRWSANPAAASPPPRGWCCG